MLDYLNYLNLPFDKNAILNLRKERENIFNTKGLKELRETYDSIAQLKSSDNCFSQDAVRIGQSDDLSQKEQQQLKKNLLKLLPWRKGPFNIFGINIVSEWQSHLKWNRIKAILPNLQNKIIADIGCNNGYYMYRMLADNPKAVIGFDPAVRYYYQFLSLQKLTTNNTLYFEPFGMENLVFYKECFDLIFCMGILYHHKDPIGILRTIHESLRDKGIIIIESQGIPGNEPVALFPEKTYAKVPGTYFVPTANCIVNWLKKSYFKNIDIFYTHSMTNNEQRKTEWMPWESYEDFINENTGLTVEGYPAPIRIYIRAEKRNI